MIADKACYERGCACHDPRDGDGVEVTEKREWIGLTEDERMELYRKFTDSDEWTYEKAIEAKLKEKNT